MNARHFRRLVWVLAAAVILFVAARRWGAIARRTPARMPPPTSLEVTSTLSTTPAATNDPVMQAEAQLHDREHAQLPTRKVSKDRRIKFRGQRYGPLPEALIGQQVGVKERADQVQIAFDGEIVATFPLAK